MSIKDTKHKPFRFAGVNIPKPLQKIPSSPKELFIVGDSLDDFLQQPRIAIVGTRKVTSYGKHITEMLASELAQNGVVIISGLALGVDGIAHRATLDAGGKTIAVLPCGIDDIAPRTHTQLAHNIVEQGGVLLSEYPDTYPPLRENFVARNRLVAGLADAVLITEAAIKSGTLHTVNFALEQGKPVFAVPGNITSPMSAGCNQLIKTGATPVTSANDILEALGLNDDKQTRLITASNQEEQIIIDLLQQGITDGHELLSKSKLPPQIFNQTLTMLEISGSIKPLGNNNWSLK